MRAILAQRVAAFAPKPQFLALCHLQTVIIGRFVGFVAAFLQGCD
jgi:hypothetical protein